MRRLRITIVVAIRPMRSGAARLVSQVVGCVIIIIAVIRIPSVINPAVLGQTQISLRIAVGDRHEAAATVVSAADVIVVAGVEGVDFHAAKTPAG